MCSPNYENFYFWIQTSNLAYCFEKATYAIGKRELFLIICIVFRWRAVRINFVNM